MQTKKLLCLQLLMQSYFCRKKITRADYRIFCLQRVRIFPIHTFYIDFRKCTLHAFIQLGIYDHLRFFEHIVEGYHYPWHDYKLPRDYRSLT